MDMLIAAAGRAPRQRTTLYGRPSAARRDASYGAAPLAQVELTAPRKAPAQAAL
jgi:hypothetical protein